MSTPHLSVIVTTYKRDDMLAECLASLAAQALPLHEVVVIDDGGSGSARLVVERFGERFRYMWQPNGGMQNARNHGARVSTGDWIGFLDDDDLWLPERHGQVMAVIATGQVNLIAGNFIKFGDGWMAPTDVYEEMTQQSPHFWDEIHRVPGENYSLVGKFPTERLAPVYPFWPSTLVIQRKFLTQLGGWNERLRGVKSEDIEFAYRAIKHGQLGIIWPITVHYRSHAGNDSSQTLEVALGRIHVWEVLLRDQDLTQLETESLKKAIRKSFHEVLWEAFSRRRFGVVVDTARKINPADLSSTEKLKVWLSRLFMSLRLQKAA